LACFFITILLIVGINWWLKKQFSENIVLGDAIAENYRLMWTVDFIEMWLRQVAPLILIHTSDELASQGGCVAGTCINWTDPPAWESLYGNFSQQVYGKLEALTYDLRFPNFITMPDVWVENITELEDFYLWFEARLVSHKDEAIVAERTIQVEGGNPIRYGRLLERGFDARERFYQRPDCELSGDLGGGFSFTSGVVAEKVVRIDVLDSQSWIVPCQNLLLSYELDVTCTKPGHCLDGKDLACVECGPDTCYECEDSPADTDCAPSGEFCQACNGAGLCNQIPPDDPDCGIIDCGGWYVQTGTEGVTDVEYCYNKQDITSDRCEGFGNCKDANTADCDPQPNDALQYSCGTCQYISASDCTETILGSCSNYPDGTSCNRQEGETCYFNCECQGGSPVEDTCSLGQCCDCTDTGCQPNDENCPAGQTCQTDCSCA
jgi:hypothetical protein